MRTRLELAEVSVDVVRKDIRNIHLTVHPPDGRVRLAAPTRMSVDTLRVYAIAKLGWIRKQQAKLREQEREPARELVERESHYVWGRRYLLVMEPGRQGPLVELTSSRLVMRAPPHWDSSRRQAAMDTWYRGILRDAVGPLLGEWTARMGVSPSAVQIRRMKTRWGSCSNQTGRILLNTELAKKPRACLTYVLVHELAHLIEPTHNARFQRVMAEHLPQWEAHRALLNALPLRQERWSL